MFGLDINWNDIWVELLKWVSTSGLRVLAYIIGAIIVIKLVKKIGNKILARFEDDDDTTRNEIERRADTLFNVINVTTKVFVWTIVLFMILKEIGADLAPLLTGAGVIGIAVGFGAQNIVKDFFNGFLILLENQYRVGDVVKIADRAGLVESINLRTTVLRDLEGVVHVIPNGQIGPVDNMTFLESRAVIDVGISYNSSMDKAIEEITKIGDEMKSGEEFGTFIRGFDILGINNLGNSSVDIRVKITTEPLQQWSIARKFRYLVKKRFDEVGIEIPFPHQTVYLRQEKEKRFRIENEAAS
ncbi:MAG TPA: mechanosensitive ion channel family protein [candidate division Zixibacteria bacterium]|nr:mechanosensitive ion channel family protein [candidate division Zixibacteria bacterium]